MSEDKKVVDLDGEGLRDAPSVILLDLLILVLSELVRRVDASESKKPH